MILTETDYEESVTVIAREIMASKTSLNVKFTPGNIIDMPPGFSAVIYLKEGEAGLFNVNNDCLISEIKSPAIIGLTFLFFQSYHMYLNFNKKSEAVYINQDEFIRLCDKHSLWRNVSQIIANAERKLHSSPTLFSFKTVYDIVRFHLEAIWDMPDIERNKISIYQYILERARISRSSLHKIIRELNTGGYITTQRGKLMNLNKLPVKY